MGNFAENLNLGNCVRPPALNQTMMGMTAEHPVGEISAIRRYFVIYTT